MSSSYFAFASRIRGWGRHCRNDHFLAGHPKRSEGNDTRSFIGVPLQTLTALGACFVRAGGAIALWIGPGTVAHFRNLSIVPE